MAQSVLIVEDEYLIAMQLQLMLESLGWLVIGPASSVTEALGLLEQDLPSVALLDVNLRDELITPVAEALSRLGVPFALASAHNQPERYGGPILAGVPNAGKPTSERRLQAALLKAMGI